jgi:hypothetical protein
MKKTKKPAKKTATKAKKKAPAKAVALRAETKTVWAVISPDGDVDALYEDEGDAGTHAAAETVEGEEYTVESREVDISVVVRTEFDVTNI